MRGYESLVNTWSTGYEKRDKERYRDKGMEENTDSKLPAKNKQDPRIKHTLWMDFKKVKLDGRTKLSKWMKQLRTQLAQDLGPDLSTQQEILLDRVVAKVVKCKLYEIGVLSGEPFGSRDHYLALANSLRLDLQLLGLDRKVKKTVDLEEYLQKKTRRGTF
jgi:hypothetical protein